ERMNLLLDISKAFSDSKISVKNMNARSGKNSAIFDVTVEINGKEQLDKIITKILSIKGVSEINRI
ncbi:MAG: hypothetical protein FWD82_09520, partial [Defluviitaleaceae bacterium]|nr:hypothetical protein [Defluviitaleaceae bacterium]